MDPVLGRIVVEAEEHLEVVAQLVGGLRPLRAELGVEGFRRVSGVLTIFGLADLGQHLLCERLDRLRQGVEDIGTLVHPTLLLFGLGEDVA